MVLFDRSTGWCARGRSGWRFVRNGHKRLSADPAVKSDSAVVTHAQIVQRSDTTVVMVQVLRSNWGLCRGSGPCDPSRGLFIPVQT